MSKHLLLIGDLGAGANLVKNLCLLDRSFNSPWKNPYSTFKSLYSSTNFKNWLRQEQKTRFWNSQLGFDISDDLGIHDLSTVDKTVFINHSAFWQTEKLQHYKDTCDILLVAPLTDQGLRWQIRAYVEKKGIDKLHNFSFQHPETEAPEYISKFGINEYYKFNVQNMFEICTRRRDELVASGMDVLDMSFAYAGTNNIVDYINSTYKTNIPVDQAHEIFELWHNLHWNFEDTDNWEWNEKYYDRIAKH